MTDHDFLHPVLEQGITTVVTGNCGLSPAPFSAGSQKLFNDFGELLVDGPLSFTWNAMADFLEHLSQGKLLFNNAQLLGHGAVHLAELDDMMGRHQRRQIQRVVERTALELRSGAFGLSLGLMYPPGLFYGSEDLKTLVAKAGQRPMRLFK